MPTGPGAVLGVGEDERVQLLLAERVLLVERVVPVVARPRRAIRGRRAGRACRSAGPLIISCHGGHRGRRDRALEPEPRAERLRAAAEPVPRCEVGVGDRRPRRRRATCTRHAARATTSPARADGRSRRARSPAASRAGDGRARRCSASSSASSDKPAGHELAVAVGVEPVRRHPERAVRERVLEQHHHQLALGVGRRPLPRVAAHRGSRATRCARCTRTA